MRVALVSGSPLLAQTMQQSVARRSGVAFAHYPDCGGLVQATAGSIPSVIVCDAGSDAEAGGVALQMIWAAPHLAGVPLVLLYPSAAEARANALAAAHPQIALLLAKPCAVDRLVDACFRIAASARATVVPVPAPVDPAPLLSAAARRDGFREGFEWTRMSEPVRFEGGRAAAFSDACAYVLGVADGLSRQLPTGALTGLVVSAGAEFGVMFSGRVESGEPDDFHVLGALFEGRVDPDEILWASVEGLS